MDLIQLHLKLQKNLESKKVTEKGEYYFAKGFKYVVSCAKKKYSTLQANKHHGKKLGPGFTFTL